MEEQLPRGTKLNRIRVVVAVDNVLLRAGLRELLETASNVEIVAEARNGLEALELAKQLRPRVLVSDIAVPGLDGLEVTKRLAKDDPDVRVMIFSTQSSEDDIRRAIQAGAAGYLLDGASAAELEFAISAVAAGDAYLTPVVSRQLVEDYRRRGQHDYRRLERLTARQQQILHLIAEGRTTKEIARFLRISTKTVETHRAKLMERLDIHDVAGLVRFAIHEGVIKSG
jgi:DNA-binding NarL/FixJ family response regulator